MEQQKKHEEDVLKETDKLGVIPKEDLEGSDADTDDSIGNAGEQAEQSEGSDADAH